MPPSGKKMGKICFQAIVCLYQIIFRPNCAKYWQGYLHSWIIRLSYCTSKNTLFLLLLLLSWLLSSSLVTSLLRNNLPIPYLFRSNISLHDLMAWRKNKEYVCHMIARDTAGVQCLEVYNNNNLYLLPLALKITVILQ